jgi:preprotein translocase subunit SecE
MSVQDNVQGNKMRFGKFLREVRAEIKKVAWPNKKELQAYTGVVFITVAVMSAVIWVMDTSLNALLQLIIR